MPAGECAAILTNFVPNILDVSYSPGNPRAGKRSRVRNDRYRRIVTMLKVSRLFSLLLLSDAGCDLAKRSRSIDSGQRLHELSTRVAHTTNKIFKYIEKC